MSDTTDPRRRGAQPKWHVEIESDYTNVESDGYTVAADVSNDDAHLIAAAPELYEALEAMLEDGVFAGCDWIPSDSAKQRADAALAKARGES